MSKLFSTILPSLLAGGLIFGSALTGAQPAPPAAPAAPGTPVAPLPPRPPKAPKIKADIHIDLSHLDDMVDEQIQHALEAVSNNPNIPPLIRDKLKDRLEKVRIKVKKRLAKVDMQDPEALGDELGKLGDEIGQEMDQFGHDMDIWGKDFEKQWEKKAKELEKQAEKQAKQFEKMKHGRFSWVGPGSAADVDVDVDTDDDIPGAVVAGDEPDDIDMNDLGDLRLNATQKQNLKRFRQESDQQVESAKQDLERASQELQKQLGRTDVSDGEINRAIDNVSQAEARIRKARILAWVKARRELQADQRDKVERAARKGK